ncbi:hypothetical protein LCGC14_2451920 [marine sediment metagenome]|uniref:Lipoprotein SmpA/OmlA domain-containing protein n=1 Tax=marine sediment metagenome TaxID=412755 RepID=A0A0F9C3F2_9ZZZZ
MIGYPYPAGRALETTMHKMLIAALAATMVMTMTVGCGSKVSKGNYDKIETGMTLAKVESLLGKGTEQASGAWILGDTVASGKVLTWTDGNKRISVTFKDDKVLTKAGEGL